MSRLPRRRRRRPRREQSTQPHSRLDLPLKYRLRVCSRYWSGSGSWLFGIRRVDRRPCCEVQRAAGAGASRSKLSTEQHGPWADRPRPHGQRSRGTESVRWSPPSLSSFSYFDFALSVFFFAHFRPRLGVGPRLAAVLRFARCSRAGGAGHSAQERKEVSSLMHDRGRRDHDATRAASLT